MATVTTAPGTPSGLRYGRAMCGIVWRRRMKEMPCIAYEIMAPNTAMFSSVPPISAPPASAPRRNHTASMMPNPSTVPA